MKRPHKAEIVFLQMAYNRFYDIFEEVFSDGFWRQDDWFRLSRVKDAFGIYSEVIEYPPLKDVLKQLKILRPPMESEIADELFRFIRNVIIHFPLFERWNDIFMNKQIINWNREGQSIDRFLKEYSGKDEVKYRIWEEKIKKMTYLSIKFPKKYSVETKIYLRDILSEKEGIKFALILMRKVMDTQVEK